MYVSNLFIFTILKVISPSLLWVGNWHSETEQVAKWSDLETGSQVPQAGLGRAVLPRMTLNSWLSCLFLPPEGQGDVSTPPLPDWAVWSLTFQIPLTDTAALHEPGRSAQLIWLGCLLNTISFRHRLIRMELAISWLRSGWCICLRAFSRCKRDKFPWTISF